MIVYESTVSLAGNTVASRQQRVLAQLYDGTDMLGVEFAVSSSASDRNDVQPAVAPILGEGGGFIVSWISTPIGTADAGVGRLLGRVFNMDGTPRSPAFQINALAEAVVPTHALAALVDGNLVAVWTSKPRTDASPCPTLQRSVQAQVFDQNGTPLGAQFSVSGMAGTDQYDPAVSGLDAVGGYVVTWTSTLAAGDGGTRIVAQLFNARSARVGGVFPVNQNTTYFQT